MLQGGRGGDVVAPVQHVVDVFGLELHLAQRLALGEADQLRQLQQDRGGGREVGADRVSDRPGDLVDFTEFGRDLLTQVAQEVLLAGDAHEVGVGVAVAHVVERVFVAQLLVAGLQVDAGVVGFGGADVFVEVAVVDVDVHAPQRVHHADEAGERHVDDPVQFEAGQHFFDRLRGEVGALVVPGQGAAERVGGVDLLGVERFAVGHFDRHEQIARDREHRGLFLFGVEAHQQDRVAVGPRFAFVDVRRAVAFVGAEDQEGLRPAGVDRGDQALGRVDLVEPREHLVGDAVGGAHGHRGRCPAAQQYDQHARDREALPHADPQPRRALVIHGFSRR